MGRILVNLTVSNFVDISTNREKIRSLEIENALVDTGATMLSLHKDQIEELGLKYMGKMKVRTANEAIERDVFGVARVHIMGREADFDVMEIPDDVPVLVGYLILEQLDFVPDTIQQKLIPNPAHGGSMRWICMMWSLSRKDNFLQKRKPVIRNKIDFRIRFI